MRPRLNECKELHDKRVAENATAVILLRGATHGNQKPRLDLKTVYSPMFPHHSWLSSLLFLCSVPPTILSTALRHALPTNRRVTSQQCYTSFLNFWPLYEYILYLVSRFWLSTSAVWCTRRPHTLHKDHASVSSAVVACGEF